MKRKGMIFGIIAILAAGVGNGWGTTNDVSGLLQRGLFEEEANHNLDAAIESYKTVVRQTEKDHQYQATAVFRLGECYRKQGKTNEANAEYQRVLREFPDQEELATLSRQQLGGAAETSPAGPASSARIAEILKLSPEQRRVAVQQQFPNSVLDALMKRMNEVGQELAQMKSDHGPQHPDVTKQEALLKTIQAQVDEQVNGVLALRSGTEAQGGVAEATTSTDPIEDSEIKRLRELSKDSPDLINAYNPREGGTPLAHAALMYQLKVVKFLLDNKADTEGHDLSGRTALVIAAGNGVMEMAKLLLGHGADINAASGYSPDQGGGALHLAASRGHKSMVELLLDHGARVDARNGSGSTPLMLASENGFRAVVETLLAKGADVNARDDGGKTALFAAVSAGNRAIAELLLARGAKINATDLAGKSALFFAIETQNPAMVDLLLTNHADANLRSSNEGTPLMTAASRKNLAIARALLNHGAEVNSELLTSHGGSPRLTALSLAVLADNPEMAEMLLQHHANPNSINDDAYSSSLMWAAGHGHLDVCKILLEHGADPNLTNSAGMTALWLAYGAYGDNQLRISALLLEHKADTEIHYRSQGGETILGHAAANTELARARLLLAHGADANAKDDRGRTPLDYLVTDPRISQPRLGLMEEMRSLLREHGGRSGDETASIRVMRTGTLAPDPIFWRDAAGYNRHTLLELVANMYGDAGTAPGSIDPATGPVYRPKFGLGFPDLSRVRIFQRTESGRTNVEAFDLAAACARQDCSANVRLAWGDIVDIPELDHKVADIYQGLSQQVKETLIKCLTREVEIIVKGESFRAQLTPDLSDRRMGGVVPVNPGFRTEFSERLARLSSKASAQPPPEKVIHLSSFWLNTVVRGANVILASSDLTRVKVTRQGKEMVFNLENIKPNADLWLEDGDRIELPEKGQ